MNKQYKTIFKIHFYSTGCNHVLLVTKINSPVLLKRHSEVAEEYLNKFNNLKIGTSLEIKLNQNK